MFNLFYLLSFELFFFWHTNLPALVRGATPAWPICSSASRARLLVHIHIWPVPLCWQVTVLIQFYSQETAFTLFAMHLLHHHDSVLTLHLLA